MSSSVKDGKLIKASPSLINSFDPSTPFGCERRGWFKYVAGKEEPSTGNQSLGVELHRLNEEFLLGREVSSEIPEALELFRAGVWKLAELRNSDYSFKVEHVIDTELAGVRVSGVCDFSGYEGLVVDWKTTSNIRKYGKTKKELTKDTQLLIYARAIFPERDVTLAHGQYQTKGTTQYSFVDAAVTAEEVDREIDAVIIPKLERIKTLVAESDVTKIDRNAKACGLCPHRSYCPTKGSEVIMSIFNKYSKAASQQTAIPQILPPDAPASDPQLASDPPPSASSSPPSASSSPPPASSSPPSASSSPPSAEAPKKRGRPLGSGKKFSDTPAEGVVFESVTVSYGLTIKIGDYSTARIDVGMTARSSDADAAYAEVLTKVKQKVLEELAEIELLKGKK